MSKPVAWMDKFTTPSHPDGDVTLLVAEIMRKDAAIAELLAALKDAREMVDEWSVYATPYFQEKWDLVGDLAKLDAAINKAES